MIRTSTRTPLSNPKMKQQHIYFIQILLVVGITVGSQSLDFDRIKWIASVARYVFYLLAIEATGEACKIVYDIFHKKGDWDVMVYTERLNKNRCMIFFGAASILFFNKLNLFAEDFPVLFFAYLIVKYPDIEQSSSLISYGVGMACSFFEGYLVHIIPSDGHKFVGFEENMRVFEASQGVVFPVKRLFLVVNKSLHCPPDLKDFNKPNRDDLPRLEALQVSDEENAMQTLLDVEKDVAGVKKRIYHNSAYKIYRPDKKPVCLAAECVTPLHTLSRVLQNRDLYEELSGIIVDDVVDDFCTTLRRIIDKSPVCMNKCELVFFDDRDPQQNLADLLLDRIRELEPNFENIERK